MSTAQHIVPEATSEPESSDIESDDESSDDELLGRDEGAPSQETSRRLHNAKGQLMFTVVLSFLLVIVVTVFSLSLGQLFVKNASKSLSQEVLSACMIVGIIVILILYVKNDVIVEVPRTSSVGPRSVRNKLSYILSHFLSVVGMSFFYPFSCIFDLFHVVTTASCDDVWRQCGGSAYEHHIAEVIFHLLRILFMGAELVFCLRFHSARFKRNGRVRCGLMTVMAINLGLWFSTLLDETADRDLEPPHKKFSNFSSIQLPIGCRNATDLNYTMQCVTLTTPEYKRLADIKPYLFPFAIEFSILVGEFLAEKFFRCGKPTGESTSKRRVGLPAANYQGMIAFADASVDDVHPAAAARSRPFRWTFVLVVTIGIFLNVICITLAFYSTPFDDVHSDTIVVTGRLTFLNYMIFYWVATTALIVVGFGCGGSARLHQKKMRGIDYLVLVSAFGPLIEASISVIAIVRNSEKIGLSVNWMVFVASEVTNALQFAAQVPFLFYSDRVRFSEAERGSLLEGTFKAVVLSMAISNINHWVLDSLLLANVSIRPLLLKPFFPGDPSSWYFLNGILLPLTIFFRFSSFLLFLRTYLGG